MDTIFNSTKTNPRGIPEAPFVEKVEDFIKDVSDFELVFNKFQERLSKYKYMQESKLSTIKMLSTRIPDIESTLKICKTLKAKSESAEDDGGAEIETHYQLNDTLYAKAVINTKEATNVGLWLGAEVMLEYPVEEAIDLLEKKLKDSKESLEVSREDSDFLRENITTMEVNCARLYNWDVQKRQEMKNISEDTNNLKI
ncbi:hypothetical protein TPHA_0M00550 [Tetrapisispora phaffii CBS 4417]|uniref:Prefoldin subunit 3 n=1 Tax=Tetrapisispora phaffii (strain ATCC 24235 / CBS 4417 / NBRC 1672 / NRRL Y-8282 / UCD 70-5) TaxID=1071381 RepID=G8C0B5_TETPH|nr:hypothetical protein TPHA_0M00550 [Tetrapisispora phaffii CBS 4417]CCE65630.1 hypothetical protein TPHA_0M00550 [Tetrapisispora phaffii CBS 4417]